MVSFTRPGKETPGKLYSAVFNFLADFPQVYVNVKVINGIFVIAQHVTSRYIEHQLEDGDCVKCEERVCFNQGAYLT